MEEFIVERLEMLVLVFPVGKLEEINKELETKHPDYQMTYRGPVEWAGTEVSKLRMIVNYPKKEGTYTAAENAALDVKIPHDKLIALAKANPPPQSWYEEDFTDLTNGDTTSHL